MKNQEFLTQKRANFVNVLRSYITTSADQNPHVKINLDKYIEKISLIEKYSVDDFLKYIIFKIMPHANNLNTAVDIILSENDLDVKYFTGDQLAKIKLYLQCFIDTINSDAQI